MLTLKPEIEWTEANALLHAVGAVLTAEGREEFYNHLQYARTTAAEGPEGAKKVVESVLANLMVLAMEEVKLRAERQSDGASKSGVVGDSS